MAGVDEPQESSEDGDDRRKGQRAVCEEGQVKEEDKGTYLVLLESLGWSILDRRQ